ncbi:hypothetical protein DYB35_005671, partial [Aphanomyces astaci]
MPWGHGNRIVNGIKEYIDRFLLLPPCFLLLDLRLCHQCYLFFLSVLELVVLQASPLVMEAPTANAMGKMYHFMEKLDLDTERAAITDILTRHLPDKRIRARFEVATVDSFQSLLTAYHVKVLHFSGHGVGSQHELCFENGHGLTHKISRGDLHGLLTSSSNTSLQVVFVSSCHSEPVARVFEAAGVPHVIAVHSDSRIVDASARDFAKHFYLSLFAGKTVAASFQNAITAIKLSASTNSHRACCCSHLHLKTCKWWLGGGIHAKHSPTDCCCKPGVKLPHDESSKFLLVGTHSDHRVVVFPSMARGSFVDLTPPCPSNIPAMSKQVVSLHGKIFVGRHVETYRLVRSIWCGHVTVCTGAPGIGKSSLALAAAHYILQRRVCPDGVFYVDLEGLELSAVRYEMWDLLRNSICALNAVSAAPLTAILFDPYAIARSVGLSTGDSESSSDAEVFAELGYVEISLTKRCLLVLDKVEDLLDFDQNKTQAWLGQLVACASNTRFLLASRRAPVIPNVTLQHYTIDELSPSLSESLLRLCNPLCSVHEARSLARICGYLPLALRVIGRALANTRSNLTANDLIQRLQSEEGRLERFAGLPNAGEKECIDRCIRSSFTHLDPWLQLAFMALGLFRGGFDRAAATAVLQSVSRGGSSTSSMSSGPGSLAKSLSEPSMRPSSSSSHRTGGSLASSYRRPQSTMHRSASGLTHLETLDVESWGDKLQLLNSLLEHDDAVSTEMFLLLTLESKEERAATSLDVTSTDDVLETLNHWSLLERVSVPRKVVQTSPSSGAAKPTYETVTQYRLHSMIQLFAEDEANRRSFENAQNYALYLTWPRHSEYLARDMNATKARDEAEDECTSTSGDDVDVPVVDTLLYALLIVRGRFIFRVRLDPRQRMEVYEKAIQLSQSARVLNCSCGHMENDSTALMTTDADLDDDTPVVRDTYDTPSKDAPPCKCA